MRKRPTDFRDTILARPHEPRVSTNAHPRMERGTVSMDRDKDGNDVPSGIEPLRLAIPRRTYTMSHVEYAADRLEWLHEHRDLVGGLEFIEEPPVLRFFAGRMKSLGGWGEKLTAAFEKDFGPGY